MDDNKLHVQSHATRHFRSQRITSVALIPLTLWQVLLLHKAGLASYADIGAWIASPWNALALLVWVVIMAYHSILGLQVVIEDYVATLPRREGLIKGVNLLVILMAAATSIALVFIVFTEGKNGFSL